MGYCTVTDIQAYFTNKVFDNNSGTYMTGVKVQQFIDQQSAAVDGQISSRYVLPLTVATDLAILNMIVSKFVVAIIDDILREKTNDGTFTRQRNTKTEAQNLLDMVNDGTILLKASQNSSTIKFNNIGSDGNKVCKRFADSQIEPSPTVPRPLPGDGLSPVG